MGSLLSLAGLAPAEPLTLGFDVGNNFGGQCFRVRIDIHDSAEGGFRIVFEETLDVLGALDWWFHTVIGVDAKEPEGQ
jgi:hypothetical protein